ncbi:hypothetical protein MJH12_05450 [bacterium]|nr:hypothetical protein [bacterium]
MKKLRELKWNQSRWFDNSKKFRHLERLSSILLLLGAIIFGAGYYFNQFWTLCIPSFIILSLSIILSDYQ